jgi:hypothetical protein
MYPTTVVAWVWSAAVAAAPPLYPSRVSFCSTRCASWETFVPLSTATVTDAGWNALLLPAAVGAFVLFVAAA